MSPGASCLFTAGGRPYAVPLASVAEVVVVERLVRLPLPPPRVLGLAPLRRDLVPVVQIAPGPCQGPGHSVLILRSDHGPFGLAIDPGTTIVARDPPIPVSPELPPEDRDVPGATGRCRHPQGEATCLDPQRAWEKLRDAIGLWHAQGPTTAPA